jgi:hypothetical protein
MTEADTYWFFAYEYQQTADLADDPELKDQAQRSADKFIDLIDTAAVSCLRAGEVRIVRDEEES